MEQSIKELVEKQISQVDLAKACSVTQQAVCLWMKNNRVPARRVLQVSKVTGIKPSVLNPEVFG